MINTQRIPVLMYHRVGRANNDWERRYSIEADRFDLHMRRLEAKGMQARSLTDFFDWLAGKRDLPKGSFLLTFDDGFLGVYDHAASTLQNLGWPATVFLVSRLVGGTDEWCRTQNPSGATYPLLDKEHIASMRDQGFSFQSHTRFHPDLTTLSDDDLGRELAGAKEDLDQLLGERADYLAYPYGRYDERVLNAARNAGYKAAFSTQPGFNRCGVDPYRIRRLEVFGTDTPAMLARKVFYGGNDGSWRQPIRYYSKRIRQRIGF